MAIVLVVASVGVCVGIFGLIVLAATSSGSEGKIKKENISLYHHTDRDSALKIARSGKILQSEARAPSDDAAFGDGTYLTSLGPDSSESMVAENNYDGHHWRNKLDKTAVAIEVRIPIEKATRCQTHRDVYLYKGDLKFADAGEVLFHVRNRYGNYDTFTLAHYKNIF